MSATLLECLPGHSAREQSLQSFYYRHSSEMQKEQSESVFDGTYYPQIGSVWILFLLLLSRRARLTKTPQLGELVSPDDMTDGQRRHPPQTAIIRAAHTSLAARNGVAIVAERNIWVISEIQSRSSVSLEMLCDSVLHYICCLNTPSLMKPLPVCLSISLSLMYPYL